MAGPYELQSPKDIAMEYGGNKQKIAQAVQMGMIDPTSAVLAGMFIDRMRNAQQEEMAPQQTVAQEVMAPPRPQMAGIPGAQMAAQMPAEAGVAALPIPDDMVPDEYAGGGIIAFSNGGNPRDKETIERILREAQRGEGPNVSRAAIPASMDKVLRTLTDEQRAVYEQTGQLPPGGLGMLATRGDTPVVEEKVVEESSMPSANLRNIDYQSIINQAGGLASAFMPTQSGAAVPSIAEASKQTSDLLKESGYDTGIFEKIRQDVQQQREELKGDRSEAVNMRLIEAGLGIMSGTSANAFENIGKGATGALRGLSQDFKDLRKSERDLQEAQQNLMIKQNDAALGKARITQSTIDKAQERVDKQTENYNRTKADFAKTMLSGEIQERLARASYGSRMTDFDKKWKIYTDSLPKGEKPNPSGFAAMWGEGRVTVSEKDATKMAQEYLKMDPPDLSTPEGRARFEEIKNYFMRQGGGAAVSSASGKAPPLPSGFIEQ